MWGSVFSLLVVALFSFAPLAAATFVARRMGYRGWPVFAPWVAAIVLTLLVGAGVAWLARPNDDPMGSLGGTMAGGMLLSGYFITVVHLIVLASRRLPVRPDDTAAVF